MLENFQFVHSLGHAAYTNLGSSSDTNEKFRKLKQKKEKRETRSGFLES